MAEEKLQLIIEGQDKSGPATKSASDGLAHVGESADGATKQVDQLDKSITDVGATARTPLPNPTAPLEQGAKDATQAVDALDNAVHDVGATARTPIPDPTTPIRTGTQAATRDLAEFKATSAPIATVFADIGAATATSAQHFPDAGRTGKKSGEDIAAGASAGSHGVDGLNQSIAGAVKQALAFGAGVVVFDKLKDVGSSVFETGGKFEMLDASLQSVMKSSTAASTAMDWVTRFATNTPLQLENTAQAFIKLKNFGLDPMDGTLQALVDQTSTLGGKQEILERISSAVGQAWAKQKLQGEEILQLIEAGVPAWDLLAQATGKNAAELANMAEKGELGRDVISRLIQEMGKANEGASATAMATWAGQISNLQDNWEQFLNLIAQSGALDAFKAEISAINEAISEMAKTGELKAWAQSASDSITTVATAVKDGVIFVREHAEAFKNLAAVAAGLKLASVASEMIALGTAAAGAAKGLDLATLGAKGLTAVLRTAGWAAVAIEVAELAINLGKLHAETQRIEAAEKSAATTKKQLAERIAEVKAATQQYKDVAVLSSTEMAAKSREEQNAYITALDQARRYWAARAVEVKNHAAASAEAETILKAYTDALDAATSGVSEHNQLLLDQADMYAAISNRLEEAGIKQRAHVELTKEASEAAKILGVDLEQAVTGISADFKKGLDAVGSLRNELVKAGADGKQAGEIASLGLLKLANQATTKQEIEAVRELAIALGKDGSASAAQLITIYNALAEATKRVGDAESQAAQEMSKWHADMVSRADQITQREKDHAAAIRERQQAEIAAAQTAVDSHDQQVAAMRDMSGQFTSVWDGAKAALAEYSESEAAAIEANMQSAAKMSDSWSVVWKASDQATQKLGEMQAMQGRVDELTKAISDAAASGQDLAWAASQSVDAFKSLNAERLDGLQSAIASAQQKLAEQQAALQSLTSDHAQSARDYGESLSNAAETVAEETRKAGLELAKSLDKAITDAGAAAAQVAADFAAEMRQIRDDSRDFNAGVDDAIRGINRDGMTDAERRADLIKELQEKTKATQEAIRAGDLALAQQLRDRVVQIAQDLDQAVEGADGKLILSREKAAEQAQQYLEATRKLNDEIARAREAQAEAEQKAALKVIEEKKKADIAAAHEAHATRMAQIRDQWALDRAEAKQAHKERMEQLRAEAEQQGVSVPGLENPGQKPTGKKPEGMSARADGGPVRKDEEYVVTEEGPEVFVDENGDAWKLDGNGPTRWTAPGNGVVIPNGTHPTMTRVPRPTGDAAPRKPMGDYRPPRNDGGSYRPEALSQPISIVRLVIEDQRTGRQYPPVDVLSESLDPMQTILRELALGASVA